MKILWIRVLFCIKKEMWIMCIIEAWRELITWYFEKLRCRQKGWYVYLYIVRKMKRVCHFN